MDLDWQYAFKKLIEDGNGAPLAELLRIEGEPVPHEAKEALAELLAPGGPEMSFRRPFYWRLVVKKDGNRAKDVIKRKATATYRRLQNDGMTAEDAAREAAKRHPAVPRTIFRWLSEDEKVRARLLKQLREDEERERREDEEERERSLRS